jgi:hypothetical protein
MRRARRLRAHAVECAGKAGGIDRLEQIVDGTGGERLHGVLVIGGHEDDVGPDDRGRDIEAVLLRHTDVEEHEVRREPRQLAGGLARIAEVADDVDVRMRATQACESAARELFVVDDRDPHAGTTSSARTPTPLTCATPSLPRAP